MCIYLEDVLVTERCGLDRVKESGQIRIDFDEPEKSVSPGQVAALYDGPCCLGCGIVERTQ